jgi:carboxypeptidase Q
MKIQRMSGLVLIFVLGTGGGFFALRAQQPDATPNSPEAQTDARILAEIHDHNEIMTNLEYLSDVIGQRLTGSENLKKANDWTREKFAGYGLANAHLESWTIAHGWTRGTSRGRIVSPTEHPLTIAS